MTPLVLVSCSGLGGITMLMLLLRLLSACRLLAAALLVVLPWLVLLVLLCCLLAPRGLAYLNLVCFVVLVLLLLYA